MIQLGSIASIENSTVPRSLNRFQQLNAVKLSGVSIVPLDEALSRVVIDFSGRPGLYFNCQYTRDKVGSFDVDLPYEFFHGFVNHARATLHIENLKGENEHHKLETIYKAFGRAVREAVEIDERLGGKPASTKGVL